VTVVIPVLLPAQMFVNNLHNALHWLPTNSI